MEPRGLLAVWSDRALPPTASGAVRVRRYVETGPGAGRLLWQETADAPDRAGTEQRVGTAYRLAWSSGPAPAEDAPWLYLVQTDCADPAQEAGFYDWYDHEHLPALAGVPGVLRARRYDALAGSPASLAAFELTAREVFEGPAWLAARLTPRTDRMRRLYVNAQRRMYRLQPAIPE
jgi:hypothetical protein